MANELTKTYQATDGQEVTLNPGIMARFILGDVGQVPESEYAKVIMTCAARGLNPLAGDVAIQPHWNQKKGVNELSVVMTKDYFQRRAAMHPSYMGKEYGIVVLNEVEGRIVHKNGTGFYPEIGERLLGGWCRVHVKGREDPEYSEVSMGEYNMGYAMWKTKPATMIAKVAKSQALREAFPNEFQGLYEPEEMGMDVDQEGQPVAEDAVTIEADGETVRIPVFDEGQNVQGPSEIMAEFYGMEEF